MTSKTPKRATVAGLDLSTTGTGICFLKDDGHDTSTITRLTKKTAWSEEEMARFVDAIEEKIKANAPKLVAIEGYSHGSYNVAMLAELGGCVRVMLHRLGVPYVVFAPSTLKKYVIGTGKTPKGKGKELVILNVFKRWKVEFETNDEADAYALARMARCIVSPSEWKENSAIQRSCFAKFEPSLLCVKGFAPGLSRVASR